MSPRLGGAAVAGLLLLTLCGCAHTQSPSAAPSIEPAASPSAIGTPSDHSTAQAPATEPLSPSASNMAAGTARTLMAFYARPAVDAETWLTAMDPYLTQNEAAALTGTDPSAIPAHRLTGTVAVAPSSTSEGALVDVGTNAGTYRVLLLRTGSGWCADQITPPKS